MKYLELKDLFNPNKINGFIHKDGYKVIAINENQGFQEYPKSIELWEKLEDGRLLRIQRWLKKSILFIREGE